MLVITITPTVANMSTPVTLSLVEAAGSQSGVLQASTLLLTDLLTGANAMACTTSASRHSRPERIKGASTTWPATHLEELDGPSTSRHAHSPAERAPVRQTWWWFPSQSMGPSVSVPCQSVGPSVSVPCQSVGPSVSQSVGPLSLIHI